MKRLNYLLLDNFTQLLLKLEVYLCSILLYLAFLLLLVIECICVFFYTHISTYEAVPKYLKFED